MAQTIQLKRSSVAGNIPGTSDLALGEIAINTADGAVYIKKGNDDIVAVADNDILHINTSNSRVGIGTTSPAQKLHVGGTVEVNGNIYFDGSTTGSSNISYGTGTTQPTVAFWGEDHASYPGQVHIVGRSDNAAANSGEISFWDYTGSSWNQNMVINKDGKVGIGYSSPNNKLTVSGASDGINIIGTSSYIRWNSGDMMIRNEGSYAMGFHTYDGSASMVERMRIDSSGKVGIGTNSPAKKLEVDFTGDTVGARFTRSDTTGSSTIEFANSAGVKSTIGFNAGTNEFDIKHNSAIRFAVDNNGAVTFNSAYTFPTSDGSSNQVLTTDGSGNLSFSDVSGASGISVTNNANNRVLTGDGTNANAEANLTFDGSTLGVTGNISSGAITSSGRISTTNGLFQANEGNQKVRQYEIGSSAGTETFLLGKIENGANADGGVTGTVKAAYDYGETVNNCNIHFTFAQRSGAARGHWWYENTDDDASTDVVSVRLVDDGAGGMFVWLYVGDYVHCFVEAVWRQCSSVTDSGTLTAGTITTGTTLFDTANNPTSEMHIGRLYTHNDIYLLDDKKVNYGSSNDLQIYHDNTDSLIRNYTGDLVIQNDANDKDIIFRSDDGSGGVTPYFKLDGGNGYLITSKHNQHLDNVKSMYGGSNDLQIYHDGSNSYVVEQGTGELRLNSDNAVRIRKHDNETMALFTANGAVTLYYDNAAKLATKSDGVDITGELQADSLDIDGNGDISGNLTVGGDLNVGTADLIKEENSQLKIQSGQGVIINIDNNDAGPDIFSVTKGSSGSTILQISTSGNSSTFSGPVEATSFSDGTISGVTFIDEDSFSTNSATRVPTQQSIKAYVDAQVAGVVDTAPAALNTLNELAAALGDDASFSTTTSTALGNRLRVDTASQGLTGTQQANAITNLGITATKAELNVLDGITATTTELNYTDGVTSNIQTQLNGKLSTSGTAPHANNLNATDDRDIAPEDLSYTDDFRIYFADKGGLETGTIGSNYQDVLVLNSYSDATGGDANALAFDKSEKKIYHYQADQAATNWGTAKTLAYTDDITLSTLSITATAAEINKLDGVTATTTELNYVDGVTSNIQTQLNGKNVFIGSYSFGYTGDMDSLTGFRIIRSTSGSNRAFTSHHNVLQIPNTGSTQYEAQIAFETGSEADGGIKFRNIGGGSWSSWRRLYHEGHKPTYSELGTMAYSNLTGTPTIPTNNNQLTNGAGYITSSNSAITNKLPLAGGTMSGSIAMANYNITGVNQLEFNDPGEGIVFKQGSSGDMVLKIIDDASDNILQYSGTSAVFDVQGNITVTGTVDGRDVAADGTKLDGIEANATADQTQSDINALGITQVGTISSGTWQGTAIASAYLDSDTAHLSGTQTFTGAKTFTGGIASDTFTGSAQPGSYIDFDDDASGNGSNCVTINSLAGLNLYWDSNDNDSSSFKLFHATSEVLAVDPSGNLTLSGTVDGRDIATDGTKLDGISAGADVTPSWVPSSDPSYATQSYVGTQISNLVDSAPGTLDTLNELAAALGDDANFSTTVTNSIATKLPLAGGTMTGDLTIPNKIIHSGDTDTYLSFATADDFRIVVGNSTRAAFNTSKIHFNQEGIGQDFQVEGNTDTSLLYVDASADNVGIGTATPAHKLEVNGSFAATTKSFDIEHPSKEGMRLKHGVVEGPEHSVYVRGKSKEKVILLPDYWVDLVHEDSITVQLTAIGGGQNLYVEDIKDNKVYVNGENYFYYIQAERKDVERFEVEYGNSI